MFRMGKTLDLMVRQISYTTEFIYEIMLRQGNTECVEYRVLIKGVDHAILITSSSGQLNQQGLQHKEPC